MSKFLETSNIDEKSSNICNGCKNLTGIINITDNQVKIIAGSKHLIFSPDGKIYHLDNRCLKNVPKEIFDQTHEIPSESLTTFSKKISKNKIYNKECSICYDNRENWLIMMPCTHIICNCCYSKWKGQSTKCPYCNVPNYGLKRSFDEINNQQPKLLTTASQPCKKKKLSILKVSSLPDTLSEVDEEEDFLLDQQIMSPPMILRASSIQMTQSSLSQSVNFQSDNRYEILRGYALGATPDNPEPEINIAPVTISKEVGDFTNMILGNGKIFITATTQKTLTFNDLNVIIYQNQNGVFDQKVFFNFDYECNKSEQIDWVEHSGDTIIYGSNDISDTADQRFHKLQHGFYLDVPSNKNVEVYFTNEVIEGSTINSVKSNVDMMEAFDNVKDKIVNKLGDKNPSKIVVLGQVTYRAEHTLQSLSPNISPSCGIIINNIIHSSEWDDSTNMTCWCYMLIY